MKRIAILAVAAALSALGVAGVAAAGPSAASGGDETITQIAAGNPNFSTLVSLLQETGLDEVLNGTTKYTVFAPTNKAFAKVPKATLDALAADPELLKRVLLYHVVKGEVTSDEVVALKSAKTVAGPKVKISVKKGKVFVNNAQVTTVDIDASNGVIHVINRVLIPPSK